MRNRGGFQLPPRVPEDAVKRERAIELLGNLTQRKKMKEGKMREIEALLGGLPKSREVAQQWKVAMEHTPNARRKHLTRPTALRHRTEVLRRIRLPEVTASVDRSFVLLGCLERRYRYSQPPSIRVLEELEKRIGDYPVDEDEAHHFRKALKVLRNERRSKELRPPRIPVEDMNELVYAKMALGYYAMRRSKGVRAGRATRLEDVIGTRPRNRSVALSWKKIMSAAIRKKKRQGRTAKRLAEIERKRLKRRWAREQRKLESDMRAQLPVREVGNGTPSVVESFAGVGCESSKVSASNGKASGNGTHTNAQGAVDEGRCGDAHVMEEAVPLVRRLQRIFGVLLGRKL